MNNCCYATVSTLQRAPVFQPGYPLWLLFGWLLICTVRYCSGAFLGLSKYSCMKYKAVVLFRACDEWGSMNFIAYLNFEVLSVSPWSALICMIKWQDTKHASWFIVWTANAFLWRHGKNSLSNAILSIQKKWMPPLSILQPLLRVKFCCNFLVPEFNFRWSSQY